MATTDSTRQTICPIGSRMLIQAAEIESRKPSGIILPDSATKKSAIFRVLALGDGISSKDGKAVPCPCKIGDLIIVERYAGHDVTHQDEEYKIVGFDDVIAIYHE